MREGDIEKVLSVYDSECVFLNRSGERKKGKQELRDELAPFVHAKAAFDFDIKQVIKTDDIALMHTNGKYHRRIQGRCMPLR